MSNPSEVVVERWNREFRKWSQEYIKQHQAAITANCLFENGEQQKGHKSALRDIEKNKGNICQFVSAHTDPQHKHLLPTKILSDSYAFDRVKGEYELVFRSVIGDFISWKPGTSNALSRWPLSVDYGDEHFGCKFRKYQLESMKKFVQATPGTKEIRGQWSVNVAKDAMTVSFADDAVILRLQIGCLVERLHIMLRENAVLRTNSKERKQTLKTSCWGLEKTRFCGQFENSIVVQENHGIEIDAEHILAISPLAVYVKRDCMHCLQCGTLTVACGPETEQTVALNVRPFEIRNIEIVPLSEEEVQRLSAKYRTINVHRGGGHKSPRSKGTRKRKLKAMSGGDHSSESTTSITVEAAPRTRQREREREKEVKSTGSGQGDGHRNVIKTASCNGTVGGDDDDGFNPQKPKRARFDSFGGALSTTPQLHPTPDHCRWNMNGNDLPPSAVVHTQFHPAVITPYHPPQWSSQHTPSGALHTASGPLHDSQTQFVSDPQSPLSPFTITPQHGDPFDITASTLSQLGGLQTMPFQGQFGADSGALNLPHFGDHDVTNGPEDELQRLRQQNAFLMRTLNEQRQQIEYLSSRIQPHRSTATPFYPSHSERPPVASPLKQSSIGTEAVLPPAA